MPKIVPLHQNQSQAAPCQKALLTLEQVHIHLGRRCILHDVNLTIQPGTLTAIMGANGAGKTSFLKAIMGLLPVTAGSVLWRDKSEQTFGYLPQITDFDREFPIRVKELVAMGLIRQPISRRQKIDRVDAALDDVDLVPFADSFIQDLSAGQLKRVLFARLLVQNAAILCLDEPFAEMDEATTQKLMANLLRQQRLGKTILAVIHDSNLARQYFDDVLILSRQSIRTGKASDLSLARSIIGS